jgi:hypothetical protein
MNPTTVDMMNNFSVLQNNTTIYLLLARDGIVGVPNLGFCKKLGGKFHLTQFN